MPTTAPDLLIRLTRRPDGGTVLEMCRRDGTSTWQKREGRTAEFFAVHDLTHYAVETTLGYRRGFYGLVAEGWALRDFGTPWPRGPLPGEALPAELIVGCLDTQRAVGERLTAAQCNQSVADWYAARGAPSPVHVTDDELDIVRRSLSELVWRWQALPAGGTMELAFPAGVGAASPR